MEVKVTDKKMTEYVNLLNELLGGSMGFNAEMRTGGDEGIGDYHLYDTTDNSCMSDWEKPEDFYRMVKIQASAHEAEAGKQSSRLLAYIDFATYLYINESIMRIPSAHKKVDYLINNIATDLDETQIEILKEYSEYMFTEVREDLETYIG